MHYLLGYFLDQVDKLACFGRRNPGKMEPAGFDTHVFYEVLEQSEFSSGVVITFQVMAVTRVSAGNPDAVCTLSESRQEKLGIHPAGAGHPDCPDVRGILQSAHPSKICSAVRTPIAKEGNYLWLPLTVGNICHSLSLISHISSLQLFNHCKNMLILEPFQVNGTRTAGSHTQATTLAQSQIDFSETSVIETW